MFRIKWEYIYTYIFSYTELDKMGMENVNKCWYFPIFLHDIYTLLQELGCEFFFTKNFTGCERRMHLQRQMTTELQKH